MDAFGVDWSWLGLGGPVGLMMCVGLWLTLGSGVTRAEGIRRQIARNASEVGLRMALWLAAMAALMEVIGYRANWTW